MFVCTSDSCVQYNVYASDHVMGTLYLQTCAFFSFTCPVLQFFMNVH